MRSCPNIRCLVVVAGLIAATVPVGAAQPATPGGLPIPTLGGKQFWADELFFHQWRIQSNVLTGHCRLLDGNNLRHASGTFPQCHAKLQQIRRDRKLPPMQGKAVIVLHGLFRSRSSMDGLCKYLQQRGGYAVFNVGYPSTRREVGGHTRALARIIENLDGVEEINFVAHSMGNIVIRHYLADQTNAATGRQPDGRIKRLVMLAPPNHGSLAAMALRENEILKAVTGEAIRQLGLDWAELEGELATPGFEFGIIAGGKGDRHGLNLLLPGDDDGTVTVASTRLAGARDFAVVPILHSFIMNDAKARQYTLRFLQRGYFISADARQPVVVE